MAFSAAAIAKHLEGEVVGDPQIQLKSFTTTDHAQQGDLTFAENDGFFARAEQSAASAIIVDGNLTSSTGKVLIRVANARIAFAQTQSQGGEVKRGSSAGTSHDVTGAGGARTGAAAWPASTDARVWSRAWPCRARRTSLRSPTTTR